jgi:dienelactone hydrolase
METNITLFVKEKKLKNCTIDIFINSGNCFLRNCEKQVNVVFCRIKLSVLYAISAILLLNSISSSQELTLDYIFQDTNLVNPRPSLKYINTGSNKVYYYGDEDYDGMLSLFDYNYSTGETFKYSDTGETASEFIVMPGGNAVTIIKGDVYITRDFVSTREYTKDIRITGTDEYEYSPMVIDNCVIYRRSGNYYLKRFDSVRTISKELALTNEESDSISYQVMDITKDFKGDKNTLLRILFVKYDNSSKRPLVFPDYTGKFVNAETRRKGISKITMMEYEIHAAGKDSMYSVIHTFAYPDSARYSTSYAFYTADGASIMLDAESMDRHNRKIFRYDVTSQKVTEIYSESDTAWFEKHSNQTTSISNDEIIFESEISGFNNLYKIKTDGTGLTQIVGGSFTILESAVDEQNGKIYYTANKEHPYEYFIYQTDLNGSYHKQVTSEEGDAQELKISPDGKHLFYSQSYITKPNELHDLDISTGISTRITNTISPKFSAVEWNIPEIISFNNEEDGTLIYGFVYKPKNLNPKKKYPLICFVHGSGYLQNVTKGFSPYRDNFMVDTYLTQKDFVILDIDFRGSMGYGKEFRNKTYRNLGYWEVSDYISGINYLSSMGIIDKERVGIYGGSYGGFTTLMAMFTHPELFKAGVALRAVSNWKNYFYSNWWYTLARFGDLDSSGLSEYYERSSPYTYAENLQGHLLMTHGMLDDNVFFQDMVQLTQKLLDNKKDFEVMIYPEENHAFHKQTSWLDQYKRITGWFEKYLK